jgi:hypothetical protein
MTNIAIALRKRGYGLRSGGAIGADQAFEQGAGAEKQIFVPKHGYKGYPLLWPIPEAAYEIAKTHHPAWAYLDDFTQALMARNCQQILGPELNDPSAFVICWTPDGAEGAFARTRETGGTGLAISVASVYGVPVFNLANVASYKRILTGLGDV